ncbi:MAG: transglutaminaseTgpA domain-containing protein [Micrococcales bacterium]|nr:transglutaminaseTgpA domain-containing protein [Micrococcales bacterium]
MSLPPGPFPPPPPPRPARTWDWARAGQTGLLAAAVAGAFTSLGAVLAPGRWTGAVIGAVALVATVLVVVRLLLPWPGVAPVAAVLFGAWLVVAVFGDPDAVHLLPSDQTFDLLGETVRSGAHEIWVGKPPLAAGPGVVLFLVAGAAALLVFADLCVSVEVPVVSGFALLTPWLPGMVLGHPTSVWSLVLTAGPWLVLLADVGRLTWWRRGVVVACSAAAVVVALALTPVFGHLPGWGEAVRLLPFNQTISLSDDLDLRHDLTAQSDHVAFRYTVSGVSAAELGPLRVFTATSFDGAGWDIPRPPFGTTDPPRGPLGTPAQGAEQTPTVVTVEIVGLVDRYLPITASARTLNLYQSWGYDEERDLVWLPDRSAEGMSYTMETLVPAWTADQLRAVGTSAGPPDALTVPDTPHSADIAALATQVTDGATTAYDQALALQTWLRSGGFVYDTAAPDSSDDMVWGFLGAKRGYCMHYATTMVVMARTQGIPARLAVGFLPGRTGRDGVVEVTGRNAHAWPELWFDDVGWVRFEPTPSRQTGPAPTWAPEPSSGPQPGASQLPTDRPTAAPPATALPSPGGTVTPPATPAPGRTADRGPNLGWLVALLGGILAASAAAFAFVARRQARAAPPDLEQAWVRARRAFARAQMAWPESTTPRQVLTLPLTGLVPGDENDDAVRDALTALATALESARYARPDSTRPVEGAPVAAWVATIETGLRRHRSAPRTR